LLAQFEPLCIAVEHVEGLLDRLAVLAFREQRSPLRAVRAPADRPNLACGNQLLEDGQYVVRTIEAEPAEVELVQVEISSRTSPRAAAINFSLCPQPYTSAVSYYYQRAMVPAGNGSENVVEAISVLRLSGLAGR